MKQGHPWKRKWDHKGKGLSKLGARSGQETQRLLSPREGGLPTKRDWYGVSRSANKEGDERAHLLSKPHVGSLFELIQDLEWKKWLNIFRNVGPAFTFTVVPDAWGLGAVNRQTFTIQQDYSLPTVGRMGDHFEGQSFEMNQRSIQVLSGGVQLRTVSWITLGSVNTCSGSLYCLWWSRRYVSTCNYGQNGIISIFYNFQSTRKQSDDQEFCLIATKGENSLNSPQR